jgi:hypothetical protein
MEARPQGKDGNILDIDVFIIYLVEIRVVRVGALMIGGRYLCWLRFEHAQLS